MIFSINACPCLSAGTALQVGSAEEWNPKELEFIISSLSGLG
jgi:hypothetical protein